MAADLKGEAVGLSIDEAVVRKEKFSSLWRLLRSKDNLMFQRARSKRLKEGDANSRYFHSCVKSRGARNRIAALRVGNSWVEDVRGIRAAVSSFFESHFAEETWDLPNIGRGIFFNTLPSTGGGAVGSVFSRGD